MSNKERYEQLIDLEDKIIKHMETSLKNGFFPNIEIINTLEKVQRMIRDTGMSY